MARRPTYNRHTGVLIPPPGPYAGPHVLYTFHGLLPGGETWSCGLRTAVVSPTFAELDRLCQGADTAFGNFWTTAPGSIKTQNPSGCTYDGVTARSLTADGVTIFQAQHGALGPVPGSSPNAPGGDQLALTLSLLTPLAGRSGRGRIYLPFTAAGTSPITGRLDQGTIGNVALGASQLIDALNTSNVSGTINPAISIQSRVGGGHSSPVTGLKVGDVLDTIRGRRKKLKEVYDNGGAITPPVIHP